MISKKMQQEVAGSSAIRAMFQEGKAMAAKIGAENVFDFSLGNPMTPVPAEYNQAIIDAVKNESSLELHGYMDNAGYPETRQAIADNLNQRFGTAFEHKHIGMTVGVMSPITRGF